MPKERRMTPIRVPDMVWMKEDIHNKFQDHRRTLEMERDKLISAELDKLVPEYTVALGVDKLLKKFEKSHQKRKDFEMTMDTQLTILLAEELEDAKAIEELINNHSETIKEVGQHFRLALVNNYGSDRRPELGVITRHIQSMCQKEAERQYEKSRKGLALKKLNQAENACYQVLHSGYDITDARRFIDDVFRQMGIDSPVVPDLSSGLTWDGAK